MSHWYSYPQSWTLTRNAEELKRAGHCVYYRGDGAHHDTGICSKCREEAANKRKAKDEAQ